MSPRPFVSLLLRSSGCTRKVPYSVTQRVARGHPQLWTTEGGKGVLLQSFRPIFARLLYLILRPPELSTVFFFAFLCGLPLPFFSPLVLAGQVVIWRVKAVPLDDNSSISLFVRAIYQLEENSEVVKDTDTHYNSKDGTGMYNWRMVFDVLIPAQIPVLKLQIWNYALLSSTEPIGEANFDLTADFFRARKRQQNYRVPK